MKIHRTPRCHSEGVDAQASVSELADHAEQRRQCVCDQILSRIERERLAHSVGRQRATNRIQEFLATVGTGLIALSVPRAAGARVWVIGRRHARRIAHGVPISRPSHPHIGSYWQP